jgi:pimeloyl-ACP methyl ester carboxylesterase
MANSGSHARALDGTPIAYQREGADGTGRRPLLLLAGQSNNHHWWDRVRADFHATHTTITMDWRGTGDSGKPDEPYSTPGLADDAAAVLDTLGLDRVDVYGTSMGGRVAQWLAARHPARVRRLVLGCTSPGGPHAVERDAAVRRAIADPDPTRALQTLLDLMYTPAWRAAHPGPYRTIGDARMPAYARRRHLAASDAHDAWEALPRIQAPTLVLHGEDDRVTPPVNAGLIASRVPNARAEIIPGARHAYFEECRPRASELVTAFLGEEQEPH